MVASFGESTKLCVVLRSSSEGHFSAPAGSGNETTKSEARRILHQLVLQEYANAAEQIACIKERGTDHRIDFTVLNHAGSLNASEAASSRKLLSRAGAKTSTGGSGATNRNGNPMRSRQLFDR